MSMMKPFLRQTPKKTSPPIFDSTFEFLKIPDPERYRAAYQRHFDKWVNGTSSVHNSKLGRFATYEVWQTNRSDITICLLGDNLESLKQYVALLEKEKLFPKEPREMHKYIRMAHLYGAEKCAEYLNELNHQLFDKPIPIDDQMMYESIAASGNFDWLERLIVERELTKVPDCAYQHVGFDGSARLDDIAKRLFDIDPPVFKF